MRPYRILLTGSQLWDDAPAVWGALRDEVAGHPVGRDLVLVHGDCKHGADAIGARWGAQYGLTVEPHPAQWRPYGIYNPHAGKARNFEMVKLGADVCLAFIKNGSPGSTHCAEIAEEAGIRTLRWRA